MDQFQPDSPTQAGQAHEIIDRVFDRRDFVGLEIDGQLVAVGAVTNPDPDFWTAERAQPQAYVGRFMVADHTHRYCERLLATIADEALEHGIQIMRLDCWRTSTGLHDYYRRSASATWAPAPSSDEDQEPCSNSTFTTRAPCWPDSCVLTPRPNPMHSSQPGTTPLP